MAVGPPLEPGDVWRTELDTLRNSWGWFLVLGLALVILGMLAISFAFVASLVTVVTFGILLLASGFVQVASAVWARRWRGFFLHLLVGILYLIVGFFMLERPIEAVAAVTLLVAASLLVGGLFRIIAAVTTQFPNWGWVLLGGVISLLLGIAIWRQWPADALWVIGLFVGIDMIFAGWSWVMLGLAVRSLPRPAGS
jgi:uncharacterized membrane protein HdeD (DUF308 family)